MKNKHASDPFLKERLEKYDKWIKNGQISHSSKVIPVSESFDAKQWVLPTEQAMQILRQAKSVAVKNCLCRSHYKRCDNPLEICLILNDVAEKAVSEGDARYVQLEEASELLKKANENGLVHLSFYRPDHEIFTLCSCCSCCCHDLQIIKKYGRSDIMARSEYIAETDVDACIHCGECAGRCAFSARVFKDEQLTYHPEHCGGCGLCVTVCPVEATSMVLQEKLPNED